MEHRNSECDWWTEGQCSRVSTEANVGVEIDHFALVGKDQAYVVNELSVSLSTMSMPVWSSPAIVFRAFS
jgi:hypothetical protein